MSELDFCAGHRGVLLPEPKSYGVSVLGAPLLYFPSQNDTELLVLAGIHGEEPETTFFLSRAFRLVNRLLPSAAVVLCANPDGMALGTRGNANGVDLNRNFATSNWNPEFPESRSVLEAPRDTRLSPGNSPESEPETRALTSLVQILRPRSVLSIHAPIGCIDAPCRTELVASLQGIFNLPWVESIGYETPGSLGTWCNENKTECVTLELPRLSSELLYDRYGVPFAKFLASR